MINKRTLKKQLLFFFIFLSLSGCTQQVDIISIPVEITFEGEIISDNVEVGSTIKSIIEKNSIELNPLDKVEPPIFTVITDPTSINIIRVEEKFETEEIIIPFDQQTVRNESLPDQQTILIQPGVNGVQEVTYRLLYENGELFSRTEVRKVDLVSPKPEIIMVGVQSPFSSIQIEGKLVYLSSGNAWIMEEETSNRKPVITNGKLDGRVLKLSHDNNWLLYTQISDEENVINELWVVDLTKEDIEPIYLEINNIIHFADWLPRSNKTVLVSTVEPREVAPGWQANNDLLQLTLGLRGNVLRTTEIIESNSGGIYGWWGTNFIISPDSSSIAFSRPDAIGLVNVEDNELEVISKIVPYQTQSDWAWVSQVAWSDDNEILYWVSHDSDPSLSNQELSPYFSLNAYHLDKDLFLNSTQNVGMFAYPVAVRDYIKNDNFKLIFLQAIFPDSSEASRYRIMLADRDGSNLQSLFPSEDMQGLEPQIIAKSPCEVPDNCKIAFLYQGNIWLQNITQQLSAYQITGDGLITQIEWN